VGRLAATLGRAGVATAVRCSVFDNKFEDFQTEKLELMTKYPTVAEMKIVMAQLDVEIGVTQDRRDKLMKSMKARDAQVPLLFSDNYYIKSEWSAQTTTSNPLKPMSTLDILGGGTIQTLNKQSFS
jgi:hypothetical protein